MPGLASAAAVSLSLRLTYKPTVAHARERRERAAHTGCIRGFGIHWGSWHVSPVDKGGRPCQARRPHVQYSGQNPAPRSEKAPVTLGVSALLNALTNVNRSHDSLRAQRSRPALCPSGRRDPQGPLLGPGWPPASTSRVAAAPSTGSDTACERDGKAWPLLTTLQGRGTAGAPAPPSS